ncbi:MAG: hypothetical protein ACRCS6_07500, partial [Turicibacter sp.]
MHWGGSGTYFEDLGHKDFTPEELTTGTDAAVYATAKAFNEVYPNVKINYFGKVGGPDDNGVSWVQERENFKAEYGKYPDVFLSTNLVADIQRGVVADLSVFAEDPMYKTFNASLMSMLNYYGFQGGIPQYNLPWGVWVNKSLAEDNNLDVPEIDWTIDDLTNFIKQADMKIFSGMMDTTQDFMNTGTNSVRKSLAEYDGTGDYVDLDSDEIKAMLDYMPVWAKYSVWPQKDLGNVSQEVMDEYWNWGWKFFIENKLLVHPGEPWFMGEAGHPDPEFPNRIKAADWDIYPRPSTDYVDNTVGVVADPMSVYNACMNDGNNECSEEELQQIQLGYTFTAFWAGDTAAWQARADQMYSNNGVLATSLSDSFPLVTGKAFDDQMVIWYSTDGHKVFADPASKPGFHKVLDIWQKGQIWDVSDKTIPWNYDQEGETRTILYEYENYWNKDVVGATRTDSNWADLVKSKLGDWNELS